MKMNFTIEGLEGVKAGIGMYEMDKKRSAQKIVRSTTSKVARKARRDVAVSPESRRKSAGQPGDLKKSITVKYYHNDLVSTIYPKLPKGAHRSIVSKGTKVRYTKNGANRGRVTPQPFMEPAKESQISSYNLQMKKLWEQDETVI